MQATLAELGQAIWADSPPPTPTSHKILFNIKRAATRPLRRIWKDAAQLREAFLLELKE